MAKIVAISGTEPQPNQAALMSAAALGWTVVLGVTFYIFWSTAKPARKRR
jgi:hypothetical protein